MNVARRWVAPTHSLLGIDLSLHQQGIETTTTGWQGHVSDDGCAASSSFGPSVAPLAQTSESKNYRVERHECMPPCSIPQGRSPGATGPGLPRVIVQGLGILNGRLQ